jgi:hypothetical protein
MYLRHASPLTHPLRQFRRDPAFNLTIVGTLGMTVGLSTAVFSIMDAVFLRPLPYQEPSRIFSLLVCSRYTVAQGDCATTLR